MTPIAAPFAYPDPARFVEAIGAEDVACALAQRAGGRGVGRGPALALRIHVPFRRRPPSAARYLQGLREEMELAAAALGGRQAVSAIHVGGAVPLCLTDEQLAQLLALARQSFVVLADGEISVQAAPGLLAPERVARLRTAGYDRLVIALGPCEGAGGRLERLLESARAARAARFAAVGVELPCPAAACGAARVTRGLERVLAMRPDRLRLVSGLATRCQGRRALAHATLLSAGYTHLGADEFALDSDPLAAACRQGRLQLGVQGYSARPEPDILALGPSATGRIGRVAYRNLEATGPFHAALDRRRLPVARGLVLGRDEMARRAVITGLLCQGRVDFESIDLSHLIDMRTCFPDEFVLLQPLREAGLVTVDHEAIELTAKGRWQAAAVAGVFDRQLQRDLLRHRQARLD